MEKINIIVGQSGGPTAVINASLYGVIKEGMAHSEKIANVYGMINGIEGFIEDKMMNLSTELDEAELALLKLTPAAYLGSCRFKLPEDFSADIYPLIFQKLAYLNIGIFFYIGGNDSMDTVSKLSRYALLVNSSIRFIGIPKTADNDLVATDHTPGYGSAAKYVAATVREIVADASVYQQKAVTIIELMGRHAGWLTAASALARRTVGDNPLLIYLPEADFDLEEFAGAVEQAMEKQNNVVVCVSEGISDREGRFICEYNNASATDNFGHKMLNGAARVLEAFIKNRFDIKVRSVEMNVSQRCSGMIASLNDIEEAKRAGSFAVKVGLEGVTGQMIAFNRLDKKNYEIECVCRDVKEICNQEKKFPQEWIINRGTDVSEAFIHYATPLIQGEVKRKMENGLPVYLYRNK